MNNPTALALITARAGSKGLPGKNIRKLCGKPLLTWSVEAAKKSLPSDRSVIACSTDSPLIAAIANEAGAITPFLRPPDLASDTASSIDVAIHALDWFSKNQNLTFDRLLLLQPTSPLRSADDITDAMRHFTDLDCDSLISVCEARESPFRMYLESDQGTLQPLLGARDRYQQRQSMPKVFTENGALYVTSTRVLLEQKTFIGGRCVPFLMPPDRSIDIDNDDDFQSASILLEARLKKCPSA